MQATVVPAPGSRLSQAHAHNDLIDRWRTALERDDGAEVDRIVGLSRAYRREGATAGLLGPMLG